MSKSKEELEALQIEVEELSEKCCELTEELAQVTGGALDPGKFDLVALWFSHHPELNGTMSARMQYYREAGFMDEFIPTDAQNIRLLNWLMRNYGP